VLVRKVHARLKIGGSNSGLPKCIYLVKKMYLDRRGACGGGLSVGIFFIFYFSVFESFF